MGYRGYLLRRLAYALIVLFVILSLNFFVFRLMPGDPVSGILAPEFTPEIRALLRRQFGLDQPLAVQYWVYLKNLLRFNMGYSFYSSRPVLAEILERLPNTLLLLGTATFLQILIGVVAGVSAAARRGSAIEALTTGSGLVAYALPTFFLQLLLLLLFGYYVPIFPIRGTMSVPPPPGLWPALLDRLHHMVLPVGSLVLIGFGSWALYTRNTMLEALGQEYIVTARAKGVPPRRLLYRHAFRSVLPPIVTLVFLSLPNIISGAVITETVFSWFGLGRYLLEAVLRQDYPAAQAAFYFIALAVIVSNLAADLFYGLVDPRIRIGGRTQA